MRVLCVKGAKSMCCGPAYRGSRRRGEEDCVDYYSASGLRCLPTTYLTTKVLHHTAPNNQGAVRDGEVADRRSDSLWTVLLLDASSGLTNGSL